ncbi:MAG: hypothetical protein ACT4PU_07550 [Planctomycetota bacterium]
MSNTTRSLSAADLSALSPTPAETLALAEAAFRGAGLGQPAPANPLTGPAPKLAVDRAAFVTLRDAASVAATAKLLADPGAEVITMLGCGPRSRAIVPALLAAFPRLERMLCFDPNIELQAQFADEIMTTYDLASIVPPEPHEAAEGAHILVSCLPAAGQPAPMVEFDWLQAGTLCIALDLDATLMPSVFSGAQRLFADSLALWQECTAAGHFAGIAAPKEELTAVAAGRAPGRGAGAPILLSVNLGHPALEAALAGELLKRAEARNLGRMLTA